MYEITRKPKIFKVKHTEPGNFRLDYVLLPVGYLYNSAIADGKKSDKIKFFDGNTYPILAVRRLNMNSANADILCKMRYGITLKAALQRWKMNAKLEGHGEKAVSEDECLWVIFDNNEINTV